MPDEMHKKWRDKYAAPHITIKSVTPKIKRINWFSLKFSDHFDGFGKEKNTKSWLSLRLCSTFTSTKLTIFVQTRHPSSSKLGKAQPPRIKDTFTILKISRVHLTPGDMNALIYRHKDNNLKFIYSDAL